MPDIDPNGGWMPLTLPQLDFWEEFTFHPDQPVSTVAHFIDIDGDVDVDALKRAIGQTIREADILSARFHAPEESDAPRQICDPDFVPELSIVDLKNQPDPISAAKDHMKRDLTAPLDLRRDRLSAHILYRVGRSRYLWYIRAHHIIVDGYGLALIEQRCAELYNHFLGRADAGTPFHPFSGFLTEEDNYQKSSRWQKDRAYWADYFASTGGIEVLERGDEDYGEPGFHQTAALPQDFSKALLASAKAADLGWPDLLTLLSGLYIFDAVPAARNQDSSTVTLWLPFMSRWGSVGANLPALLVNILPFEMKVHRSERLVDFLTRSADELKRQRRHSRFRIEQISKDQGLAEGSRYFFSPLINVLPFKSPAFAGCKTQRNILDSGPADGFNLTFRGEDDASGMSLGIDADPSMTGRDEFERHMTELPAFLSRLLKPENLQQPLRNVIGENRSAAFLEAAAQRFPY